MTTVQTAAGFVALDIGGFRIQTSSVVIGLLNGIPIGLLAIGLILIYRVSRFINFAQGAIGVFGASVVGTLSVVYSFPYWLAFAIGVVAAAGASAGTEVAIVRRLGRLPRLLGIVATLGLAQLVLAIAFMINTKAKSGITFPKPPGMPTFTIDTVQIGPAYTGMLIVSPILLIVLHRVLRSGSLGLAIRGTASNPDATWMTGISPYRTSTITWAIAGAVAAVSATLLWPTQGFATIDSLGPALLLRGLGAALIGRLRSVVGAFAGALVIGLIDFLLRVNQSTTKYVDVVLGAIVVIAIVIEAVGGRVALSSAQWNRISLPPVVERYRALPTVRHGVLVNTLIGLFFSWLALLRFIDNSIAFTLVTTMAYAIVAMSVTLLTGVGGMLSLGQFAVAGFGATASVIVTRETGGNVIAGMLAAAVVGGVTCLVLAVPMLARPRNMVLEVTTLAIAIAAASFVLGQSWALGAGAKPGHPVIGPFRFDLPRNYYWFAIGCVLVAQGTVHLYRRSRLGRELLATRDNPQAAAAMGIPIVRRRAQAFLAAGAVAGFGGSMLAHSRTTITPQDFPATASILVVVIAAVAGLSSLGTITLAASIVVGLPLLAPGDIVLTVTTLVWLAVIVLCPRGLAAGVIPLRNWSIEESGRRRGIVPPWADISPNTSPDASPSPSTAASTAPAASTLPAVPSSEMLARDAGSGAGPGASALAILAAARSTSRRASPARSADTPGQPILVATGLVKSFGGVRAVDGVSLRVNEGEIVGLIGPNGAGKTTTFEMLSGFVDPDAGTVQLAGTDVTAWSPQRRAALGLVRSFQNALLFPTLTVRQTLDIAAGSAPGTTGRPNRRELAARAEQVTGIITAFDLAAHADTVLASLPTGLRRMTEIGAAVLLSPRVVLLDEPSAGIPHADIDRLGSLLRSLRDDLGITLVVVDHDLRLLRSISDRLLAMHLGQLIAEGTPADVIANDRVRDAYVGGSAAATARVLGHV